MGIISAVLEKPKNWFEAFRQFIGNLSDSTKILITLLVLVASMVFMVISFQMYLFIVYDDRFCVAACHPLTDTMIEPYYLWLETSHAEVTNCHDCHHGTMLDTASEVYNTVINRYTTIKKAGHVSDEKCLQCHEVEALSEREFNPLMSPTVAMLEISKVPHMTTETLKGHGIHLTREKLPCVDCHGLAVHRFVPPNNICEKCHYDPALGPPKEFLEEEGEKVEH